jgi:hypothetical protein
LNLSKANILELFILQNTQGWTSDCFLGENSSLDDRTKSAPRDPKKRLEKKSTKFALFEGLSNCHTRASPALLSICVVVKNIFHTQV